MNNGMPMNMPNMNPAMGMPNAEMGVFPPGAANYPGFDLNHAIEKMHHLEKEIRKLDKRISLLEGGPNMYPTQLKNYEDGMDYGMMKEFPQYHSGNYML